MPRRVRKSSEIDSNTYISREFPPASTIEGRENQLIALAIDRAEQQIRDGTASSQVLVHYLKLGSTRERMEKQLMEQKLELDAAKAEAIKSQKHVEELYAGALNALRKYSGNLMSEEEAYEED